MGEKLPLIYVRGFGGGQKGIDRVADDPFYGFNEGSTHIRIGARGRPRFYQFEGPLLRLMLEQGYQIRVSGSQQQQLLDAPTDALPAECVWIYRFYDENSGTFGVEPVPYEIERASRGLADFIELIRSKTTGNPRVNLIAHSMGGLICRSALQRYVVNPDESVSKLCTLGTPHGGIDPELGGGIGDWIIEKFGPNGSDIFSPSRMKQYMLPEGYEVTSQWDPREMVGAFPAQRVLSIVGTNARDYEVAHGLSALAMGEQSDGLVAIRNAYVRGSVRAYVHRSHSGRYGLVNSEEAYQNVRRFLFGTLRVELEFDGLDRQLMQGKVWQADVRLAIRALPVLMHEQTADHHCPVDLNTEAEGRATPFSPVPLVTTFLLPEGRTVCRYALSLKVSSLKEGGGFFSFGDHLEQIGEWEDSLIMDVIVGEDGLVDAVDWAWNSSVSESLSDAITLGNVLQWEADGENENWTPAIPLPNAARTLLGESSRLQLSVSRWN